MRERAEHEPEKHSKNAVDIALGTAAVSYVRKRLAIEFDGKPVIEDGSVVDFVRECWTEFWGFVGRPATVHLRVGFPEVVDDSALSFLVQGVELGAG